ncbi:MAG: Trm112 family protein [Acidimicrobiales bacterium]
MALDSFLLELLEDPVDHGSLLYIEGDQVLYNPRRRVAYQVLDSIPVLLPDEASPVSDERHDAYVKDGSARSTGKAS